jgi:hypothetical protein
LVETDREGEQLTNNRPKKECPTSSDAIVTKRSEPKKRRVRLSPEARKDAIVVGAIRFFAEEGIRDRTRTSRQDRSIGPWPSIVHLTFLADERRDRFDGLSLLLDDGPLC